MANFLPEYVSCIGRGIPQSHDNKISRPSANFMVNRTHKMDSTNLVAQPVSILKIQ